MSLTEAEGADTDDWHIRTYASEIFRRICSANSAETREHGVARNRRIRRLRKLHVFPTGLTSSNWNNEWVRAACLVDIMQHRHGHVTPSALHLC